MRRRVRLAAEWRRVCVLNGGRRAILCRHHVRNDWELC